MAIGIWLAFVYLTVLVVVPGRDWIGRWAGTDPPIKRGSGRRQQRRQTTIAKLATPMQMSRQNAKANFFDSYEI